MNSLVVVLSVLCVTTLLHSLVVHGCSCVKTTPRETFCSNSFAAVILIKSKVTCFEWHDCYDIIVKRQLKPLLQREQYTHQQDASMVRELISANTTSSCGHQFNVGSEYLVIGSQMEGVATKIEVYSCSFPVLWSSLSFSERKEVLNQLQPNEGCKKKRKRVLR